MTKEDILKAVETINSLPYKHLFAALIVNENYSYPGALEELIDGDIEYLENLYDYFMDNDGFTGLLNLEEVIDSYEDYQKYGTNEEE